MSRRGPTISRWKTSAARRLHLDDLFDALHFTVSADFLIPRGPSQSPSWRGTSTATAAPTWPSPTSAPTTCRCCWATATAPSRHQVRYAAGTEPYALVAGDFNGDGRTDLAVANYGTNDVSVLLGNGDGTFQDQVRYAAGTAPDALVAGDFNGDGRTDLAVANVRLQRRVGVAGQRRRHLPGPGAVRGGDRASTPSWRGTSTATAAPTWPSPTTAPTTCRCCWATATAPSRHQVRYAAGTRPIALVAGDFNGDGRTDLAVANYGSNDVSVLLGNGDGTFQDQVRYAAGTAANRPRGGGLQRRRPPRPGRRQLRLQRRVGVAGQRRRHLPGPGAVRGGDRATRPRGGGLQRRRPPRPGRRQLRLQRRVGAAGQRRRHLPGPGAVRGGDRPRSPSWRGTSTATAAPTWPSPTAAPTTCRCCWATATAPSRTRCDTRRGPGQSPSWRGTSTATAAPTWPSPTTAPTTCRCCWATATAPSRTRCVRGGDQASRPRGGGLQRRRPPRPGRRQRRLQRRVGVAGQRRRHLPGPGAVRGGGRAIRPRGGGLQRRRPARPGRRQLRLQRRVGVAGQRRRHLPGPGAVRGGDRAQAPSWRGTSTATAAPTWPSPTPAPTTCRCCWATATAPSRTRCGTRRGPGQTPSWRGTSTATAAPTWPSPTIGTPTTCRCCWATATAPSRTRCGTRRGPRQSPSWRGTSTATAASTWPSPTPAPTTSRCC